MKDIFENDELFFIFAEGFLSLSSAFTRKPKTFEEIDKKFADKIIEKGIKFGVIKVENPKDSDSESKN